MRVSRALMPVAGEDATGERQPEPDRPWRRARRLLRHHLADVFQKADHRLVPACRPESGLFGSPDVESGTGSGDPVAAAVDAASRSTSRSIRTWNGPTPGGAIRATGGASCPMSARRFTGWPHRLGKPSALMFNVTLGCGVLCVRTDECLVIYGRCGAPPYPVPYGCTLCRQKRRWRCGCHYGFV